jgi:formylglycine-generating enzyme required for sulfatase activity
VPRRRRCSLWLRFYRIGNGIQTWMLLRSNSKPLCSSQQLLEALLMFHSRILLYALFLSFAGEFLVLELLTQPSKARGEDKNAATEPRAGAEREFVIADGVKMKFCWIPTGKATLGSPRAERDTLLKSIVNINEPKWLAAEAENVRGKYETMGFWIGKYPVTQEEWKAVIFENPSWFQPGGKGMDKLHADNIRDTSRFPVETVTWNDCQKFLEGVNDRGGVAKVFGKSGKFVLPHEDQWEYACRGGKGNDRVFYWGDELDGRQANCDGKHPFGTTTKGQYLRRTCSVDFTNDGKYEMHPWGLCQMSGNVWQWCSNEYEQTKNDKVIRGGSWDVNARYCRSSFRAGRAPDYTYTGIGFRVCLVLEK